MGIKNLQVGDEAFDRLTRLTVVMANALDRAVELEVNLSEEPVAEVKGIIMLSDDHTSGIQLFGYEDTMAGVADLLIHLKAMLASEGKTMGIMTEQGVMVMEELMTDEPIQITDEALGYLILGTLRAAVQFPDYPVMVYDVEDNIDADGNIESFTIITASGLRFRIKVTMEEVPGEGTASD